MPVGSLPFLMLGIDTGGTYTDAVLLREMDGATEILATAKALTTRHDLALGIGAAVATVIEGVIPESIGLVSMSTTLATNAIVEAQGGRVCLVSVGFAASELERAGLPEVLGSDPSISIGGGHTSHGDESAPLDLDSLDELLDRHLPHPDELSGFAVVAQFAVRNPSHELAVRDHLRHRFDVPVTCSHELTANLNGPKRAVTSVLNARLIGLITDLIEATRTLLADRSITAPLMVVRGDGSLISAATAATRPVETILSGPAASVVGARHLTGAVDAVVSDIGGTTTDVAILVNGEPRLRAEGAVVGGHETMVEAVDIRTVGLGGDSEVWQDDSGKVTQLRLGPRRVVPVSLLAMQYPDLVGPALHRQLNDNTPRWLSGCFAQLARGVPSIAGRSEIAVRLIESLTDGPRALRDIVSTKRHEVVLDSLVSEGVVLRSGFTPTDACHVLGVHHAFDADAACAAARLLARVQGKRGTPLATSESELSLRVFDLVVERSAEVVLAAALERDGFSRGLERHELIRAGLDGHSGLVRASVSLGASLVGLGASAATYYPDVGECLGALVVLPEHAGVANAIGAVVGRVRIVRSAAITRKKNGTFNAHVGGTVSAFDDLEHAAQHVESELRLEAVRRAAESGADEVEITVERADNVAIVEGAELFVDSEITVTAAGRPHLFRRSGGFEAS